MPRLTHCLPAMQFSASPSSRNVFSSCRFFFRSTTQVFWSSSNSTLTSMPHSPISGYNAIIFWQSYSLSIMIILLLSQPQYRGNRFLFFEGSGFKVLGFKGSGVLFANLWAVNAEPLNQWTIGWCRWPAARFQAPVLRLPGLCGHLRLKYGPGNFCHPPDAGKCTAGCWKIH